MFDIVICHGPNDDEQLNMNLTYNRKNVIGYRKIFVITHDRNLKRSDCIVYHESIFPPFLKAIEKMHPEHQGNRNGWYIQQLIKLYASHIIPNILPTYLVIDCDTFFLRPTEFTNQHFMKTQYYFTHGGTKMHMPCFIHMEKMHPELKRRSQLSGVCHHMLFHRHYVTELMNRVTDHYNRIHKTNYFFYEIFILCVDKEEFNGAGASEYEIYFNFMLHFHFDKMIIRQLNWKDSRYFDPNEPGFDYISYHWHLRGK